eukprot:CAMPEP_0182428376 /NCGR_PEP_ID=MMETSP1167-20130531/22664_1 /TAXON_ID=2988 /ORGANISM="Mallomonas Sp, Strain CCMP3275" /LENGTH=119 /DNA_ID=CAMNT_0024611249 /DNA_START=279 /DNA_END=639 /DNA_ORIENTATION=+
MSESKGSCSWDPDDKEEDDRTIFVDGDDCYQHDPNSYSSPSKLRGMGLDLSFAESFTKDEMDDEEVIQESTILVVFDLPDGSQGEGEFKLGHTVEYVKSFVEAEFGIPMMEQEFFLKIN